MKKNGVVYTKEWIVNLMLDLCGYDSRIDLSRRVAVEPSCGTGVFVVQMAKRLIESCRLFGHNFDDLHGSIKAIDVCPSSITTTKRSLSALLTSENIDSQLSNKLIESWVIQDDFLIMPQFTSADFLVGNPPYLRSNDIDEEKKQKYLMNCQTMTPGSDLFIGFYEKGLSMLNSSGKLSFICADRWMHNSYGKKLRKYIIENYAVESIISMHDVNAFESNVSAYPAISTISKATQGNVIYVEATSYFDEKEAVKLADAFERKVFQGVQNCRIGEIQAKKLTDGSWPLLLPEKQALLCDLEEHFPMLESLETGTRVGIGMATGNDSIFLTRVKDLVEPEHLIPMITSRQLSTESVYTDPLWLVSPWNKDGSLSDLSNTKKLCDFFSNNRTVLGKRHIAKKNSGTWFRTIDNYRPGLENTPKLLIQDMHYRLEPYYDDKHYPHGNLYYITSEKWDLLVLGGLLMSFYCELFIDAYGVKMRGGTLRFQAQFLRKIRVPDPDTIANDIADALKKAFVNKDYSLANEAASIAFGYRENKIAV
ncbi:MAG: BREX-1 system adenine-specific DNA-methyltransferase PglX [Eggerthellaceae bacterium]|nr:BREX-1 system adenine-specific DNA-methyltransferase PglX [Eggerthellaceae bacterium]MDR2716196.1 N-6 DNA methylase [Coriobacteriaceae bacterium]